MAGVLAGAGYYLGSELWPARDANPKGFFEDVEINAINEDLIRTVTPQRPRRPLDRLFRRRPVQWQRWLAHVPVGANILPNDDIGNRIESEVAKSPFCFKDPRFCYTLPVWRPYLGDAAFLCVFRSPSDTVASILRDCREAPYLANLRISRERVLQVWTTMYRHVLDLHEQAGDWLFLHYDQVLDGSAAPRVESLLGVAADWTFPEASLRRSRSSEPVDERSRRVYLELCRRAQYPSSEARPAKGREAS